jgi:hypothetical protein
MEENKERKIIDCHPELLEILDKLDPKISDATWGAISKTSYLIKTQILARKIKASKIKI